MGLDMYLYKCDKIEGWNINDYKEVSIIVSNLPFNEYNYDPRNVDIRKLCDKPNLDKVNIIVRNGYISFFDIMEKVGYLRKANHIHQWFVKNVQENVDDCEYYFVKKEKLEELFDICKKVIRNFIIAPEVLPTQSGFFFGNIEYDDDYMNDIKDTINIIENILINTDFEKEYIIYYSSW